MRVSKFLNYALPLFVALTTVVILHHLKSFLPLQQPPSSLQSAPSSLSVVVLDHLKHSKNDLRNLQKNAASLNSLTCSPSEPNVPATLATLSDEELKDFPGATVVEATEVDGPEENQTTQIKILQTDSKYPLVRSEEVLDNDTGNVANHEEMAADHLLVSLPQGTDPTAFLNTLGPAATSMIPVTPDGSSYIVLLASPSIASLPQFLDAIAGNGIIAEPDIIHHIPAPAHSALFSTHWALDKIAGELTLFTAPSKQSTASSKLVAIIDTGIRDTHKELTSNIWHNPSANQGDFYGWNAVDNNGDTSDDNGHGTFCAGVIGAAGNNDMGFTGVVPVVRLMSCKGLDKHGDGFVSDEIKCIDYACEHGARVLNCSWGGAPSQLLYEALRRAQRAGVICVAAAGNDGTNENFYPASYGTDTSAGRMLDNVISVAASTETDDLASFSNYGTTVALAAPGVDICSTFNNADDSYATGSGTSMAAPYVTGALVLLEAQFPNDTYDAIINRLFNSADHVSGLTGKITFGRLNITKALTQ